MVSRIAAVTGIGGSGGNCWSGEYGRGSGGPRRDMSPRRWRTPGCGHGAGYAGDFGVFPAVDGMGTSPVVRPGCVMERASWVGRVIAGADHRELHSAPDCGPVTIAGVWQVG